MRQLRLPTTIALALLLSFDAVVLLHFYLHGYHVLAQSPDGTMRVKLISPNGIDWLILTLLAVAHVGLIIVVKRAWRSPVARR